MSRLRPSLLAVVAASLAAIVLPSTAAMAVPPAPAAVLAPLAVPDFPGGADGVLEVGSRGAAVRAVQNSLVTRKILKARFTRGYYDRYTAQAVLKFKLARPGHDLGTTPRVGPLTYAALTGWRGNGGGGTGTGAGTGTGTGTGGSTVRCGSVQGRTCKSTPTRGRYCPVIGAYLGDGFGVPRSGHSHMGIDLMIRSGVPIRAVESGRIIAAKRQDNGALVITQLADSGVGYYYGHNTDNVAQTGDYVRAGQVIATTGDTGSRGVSHLHFEVRLDGPYNGHINPAPLVRLLCF